jgi:hypothetical protein
MNGRRDDNHGLREGVAKCISQAAVYSLEARKTMVQLHGHVLRVPFHVALQRWGSGVVTSSLTSGLVFGTYFTVYNQFAGGLWGGPAAALATSLIKVPISNGMRVMQSGSAATLLQAGRKIVRAHTWRGLYGGYRVSLLEDLIEFDLRARMYRAVRGYDPPLPDACGAFRGMFWGAFTGAATAALTTPLDTIKAHVAQDTANPQRPVSALKVTTRVWRNHGPLGFFRGLEYRVASNMVKNALFFSVYELLP